MSRNILGCAGVTAALALFAACGSSNGTTAAASGAAGSMGSTSASSSGTSSSGASSTGKGSGTTSGAAGSTSGATSGSNSGCATDGSGDDEFGSDSCMTNADCNCPLLCGSDPVYGGAVCVYACTSNADCPDPATHCLGGQCVTNVCAADGGALAGVCNAAGTGDGVCVASEDVNSNIIGVCTQTGTLAAGTLCTQGAWRDAGAVALCTQGTNCEPQLDGGALALCTAVCDPTSSTSTCAGGTVCFENPVGFTYQDGLCVQLSDAGCGLGVAALDTQLANCTNYAACGCPATCLDDTGSGEKYCVLGCTSPADCNVPQTTCIDGYCQYNYCDTNVLQQSAPGAYDGPCTVWDAGDGTCQAQGIYSPTTGLPIAYGLCQLDGTANTLSQSCASDSTSDLAMLCMSGESCQSDIFGDSSCVPLCDPLTFDGGSCGAGYGCFGLYLDEGFFGLAPSYGFCEQCTTAPTAQTSGSCGADSECCSLKCIGNAVDGGAGDGGVCM